MYIILLLYWVTRGYTRNKRYLRNVGSNLMLRYPIFLVIYNEYILKYMYRQLIEDNIMLYLE